MIGESLGHYRVLEKIGAGGMGVVYRAHDQHLARDVAIKVLPAGTLADEAARKRFRAEAEALARLNHPHIATVHDFDTQNGTDFLVMEFVPGSSLAERLAAGSLPEKEVLRLGMQVAAALEEAHEHRIVHRDLKPANIRLTAKGDAKVLDFGLAKLLRPADDLNTRSLTQSQAAVGTLPYMAPEQLRAESVDVRTDIYAFGCVLYEVATGRRPFRETISATLTDAILHRPASSPRELVPQLSGELERIILKCLEKDPENRYQSAKELCVDLRRLATQVSAGVAAPAPPRAEAHGARQLIRSLAVLPLANLSHDSEQEYFADGMTEALITDLAKISALKVISRTSAMRYKNTDKPLPEIARELKVDALVEGSVLRAGDQVRITAQLIYGATDEHLWAESYQRPVQDVLSLQAEIARAIAQEIQAKLTPPERARLARVRPVNPAAHEAYLKGRYHWNQWHAEGFKKGVEYFQQAVQIDPSYAAAYAGLAEACAFLGYWGFLPLQEVFPKAAAAALKALTLDETLGEAHCALGAVRWFYDWDLAEAEKEFKRALELNPNDADAHAWNSVFLSVIQGDLEKGLVEMKRARELDPFSSYVNAVSAWSFFWARQYDHAIEQARRTLELNPLAVQAYYAMANAFMMKEAFPEAIDALEKATEISRDPLSLAFLGAAYARAGKSEKAQAVLRELTDKASQVPAMFFAWRYVITGEKDLAFEWLEKAYQARDPQLFWLKVSPAYVPFRDDPRTHDLLRRMNLPDN